MKNHEKAQNAPLTSGEILEFAAAVVEQLPRDLSSERVRYYTAKKSRLGKAFRELFAKPQEVVNLTEWHDFYRCVLGRDVDLSNLHIPEKPSYPCRALVIPRGVTANEFYDACAKRFKCWHHIDDLDKIHDIVSRPDGPYVIWVKDVQEADEDMKNLSANQIKERGVNTETLNERFTHELKFHDETGEHLDISNWTLCAGSRGPDGNVPGVRWNGDDMDVNLWNPDDRVGSIRARVAVS